MFDLNRRKLLIGSLITGAALSAPALAFAEDRYHVLMRLQQDYLDLLNHCKRHGVAHNIEIGYVEKKAAYSAFLKDRWSSKLTDREVTDLSSDISRAEKYMFDSSRAEWKLLGGDDKANTVLEYLLNDFNGSNLEDPKVHASVRALFRGELQIDTMDVNQLRQVEDAVVSIAFARAMFSVHRAPVDTQKMPAFDRFAHNYRTLIVS